MDLRNDLVNTRCSDPFGCLGLHPIKTGGLQLTVWRPGALSVEVLAIDRDLSLGKMFLTSHEGLFELSWPKKTEHFHYRLRFNFGDHDVTLVDPYQFSGATFSDPEHHIANRYLSEGAIHRSAPVSDRLAIDGVRFAVYAPAARSVAVVGDFNGWDGRIHPMAANGDGIWRLFIPDLKPGDRYKFEIRSQEDELLPHRSDPFAKRIEQFPSFASVVPERNQYEWQDGQWTNRSIRDVYEQPMSIYEVHLGSWRREQNNRSLTYIELTEQLVPYVVEMGYTHVELLPIMEHPFDGSWGYQPVGMYAVTSRYGTPEEFKTLVDAFHQAGIGVIMDWVPAHFPADSHGLANFDGTKQYEYPDPRKGWHPEWNSLIYDFGKDHVVNYLISNANYWLDEFHIDGLRVDAVASMLYLDYSRKDGEWIPNVDGGNHNYEAIRFLRQLNETLYLNHPRCFTIAEESTAFPGVSKPTHMDGLGFGFKWNMGWMNDSLDYIKRDPLYRQHHQGQLTFSMVYAFDEQFILPISHDEVVHGKGSMLTKMPGDTWQKFANLRAFTSYMYFHPGKKLNFMGNEIAQGLEWNHSDTLQWHQMDIDFHRAQQATTRALNQLYREESALQLDHQHRGFEWLSHDDHQNSIIAFARFNKERNEHLVILVNFTPLTHEGYRVATPASGNYRLVFNSDAENLCGSGFVVPEHYETEEIPSHGREQSILVSIPPLAAIALKYQPTTPSRKK